MATVAAILGIRTKRFKQLWIFLSPRCLPSSFCSIRHGLGGDVVLKKFEIAFTMSLKCLPSSFGSVRLTVWEEMSFEEFKDGYRSCNLRHRSGTILAILNLYLIQMPPIKFCLNPIRFGRRIHLKNLKMATVADNMHTSERQIWISMSPDATTNFQLNPTSRPERDLENVTS